VTTRKVVKTVVENARVRHYHSGDYKPYRGVLHSRTNDQELVNWPDSLLEILADLPEGTVVAIQVLANLPCEDDIDPDDIWVLKRPHVYGHKMKDEDDQ